MPESGEGASALRGVDVLYFSAIDWSFRRLPHHYITEEITRRGGQVVFIENTGIRRPTFRDMARVRRRLAHLLRSRGRLLPAREPGLRIVPPLALPPHPSRLVRAINSTLLSGQIRRVVPGLSSGMSVAIVTLPNWTSLDAARALRPGLLVYYCADEFPAVPEADPTTGDSEDELLQAANLVFVTSERLRHLCSRSGASPVFTPVGVDLQAFADAAAGKLPRPDALSGIPGRTIGYLGGLNHKVDVRLLEEVARTFRNDSVVILGEIDDPRYAPRPLPNLKILHGHAHDEIPAFLQQFDVCLIPYLRSQFTDSVYPAKLHEYLAAGRPVVSTNLPEVLRFAEVVRIASNGAEFIAHVRAALEEPDPPRSVAARIDVAARHDYSIVIPRMLAEIEQRLLARRVMLPEPGNGLR